MNKLTLLIFVLVFLGCSSVQDQDRNIDAEKSENTDLNSIAESTDFVSYPMGQPASSDVKNYRWGRLKGKKKERALKNAQRRMGKALGAVATIRPIIKNGMDEDSNESADEIISSIQDHLDKYQDREETFLIEQITASQILNVLCKNYTLKSNLTKCWNNTWDSKKIQLLNFATSLFVKNENPNADLIAYDLEKLKGSVPNETLAYYASETIKSSKAWYSSENLCIKCSSAEAPGNADRKTQLVQQGIADLKAYTN